MPEFEVVHNIPSPYRLHLFRRLAAELKRRHYGFRVHFLAKEHRDRPSGWTVGSGESFEYNNYMDLGPVLRNKRWHLNPGLMRRLHRNRPDVLMVGGPWDSLTGLFLSALGVGRSIAWIEGNTHTPGITSGLIRRAKRAVLDGYDVIAAPGTEGRRYASEVMRSRTPVVNLPNIIDESRFSLRVGESERRSLREQLRWPLDKRVALWPARLIPAKGIAEFLTLVDPAMLRGWLIVLMGQGPEYERLNALIGQRALGGQVAIRDYVQYDDMPLYYAAADLFLLPSLHDPNPLSVVEALHASLPLLTSNRLGNHTEALDPGTNGWSFDPTDNDDARRTIEKAFGTDVTTLRAMGEASRERALRYWASVEVVRGFVDQVLDGP
jgi:glycosyltransferase involved in cell wall biosynthesis